MKENNMEEKRKAEYRINNKIYSILFCFSFLWLICIFLYYLTKSIFIGLRTLGENNNWLGLTNFSHSQSAGFGVMAFLLACLIFGIYILNRRKQKRNPNMLKNNIIKTVLEANSQSVTIVQLSSESINQISKQISDSINKALAEMNKPTTNINHKNGGRKKEGK